MDFAGDHLVDGGTDCGVIQRNERDAVVHGRQGAQRRRQSLGIEDIDINDVNERLLRRQPFRCRRDLLGEFGHEEIDGRWQQESEPKAAVAGQPRRRDIHPVAELADRSFNLRDGLRADALAAIDDTIGSGERDVGLASHIVKRHPAAAHR
jgi:hypothetical protein